MRTPRTPIKPLCAPLGLGALLLAGLLGAQPALADNARMTVQIDGLRDTAAIFAFRSIANRTASARKSGPSNC